MVAELLDKSREVKAQVVEVKQAIASNQHDTQAVRAQMHAIQAQLDQENVCFTSRKLP